MQDSINVMGEGLVHIPRCADGGLQWNYRGPDKKGEFGYALNRNTYFLTLLEAWQRTHNPSFPKAFDQMIRDWTIHNPLPKRGTKGEI